MKTRQQTRMAKADVGNSDGASDPESVGTAPSESYPRRKKQARGNPSKPRLKAQKNEAQDREFLGFLSLPLDVFTEIASHLTAPDVMNLSRSNKLLRGILIYRSAARIWARALSNVPGLPPCPRDLCEPQYTALIFSKHCSTCGASVVKPMDPYLQVRLCNACRDTSIMEVHRIEDTKLVALHCFDIGMMGRFIVNSPNLCLRSNKEELEKAYATLPTKGTKEEKVFMDARARLCYKREKWAHKVETYLEDAANARSKELDELRNERRADVKLRLTEAGWEESDWMFPQTVARNWAALVEAPKPLTDRVWQNLYPKLVPYLQKNHDFQLQRFKDDRCRRRERRMRALLLAIRKQKVLLKIDHKTIRGEASNSDDTAIAPFLDSDGDLLSDGGDSWNPAFIEFAGPSKVKIERAFPPMVDALNLSTISEFLEDDTDANTLEDRFEESRDKVEEMLESWASTVEQELVDILNSSGQSLQFQHEEETIGSVHELDLRFELPATYTSFLDGLLPNTRRLLRADSVFRIADDKQAPPPLFYPELFSIFQDRTAGYFGKLMDYFRQQHPKMGRPWNTDDVVHYPEAAAVSRAILKEIGWSNATQFELQALGSRFTCGQCPDKFVRTWNEIIHHHAEALIHERLVHEHLGTTNDSAVYNALHSVDPSAQIKGKNKPLVHFHTLQEARVLMESADERDQQWMVKCNLCFDLGVSFLTTRSTMSKHIRAVHAIQKPKAEHRTKVYDDLGHQEINTRAIKPRVSDPSSEEEVDTDTLSAHAKKRGFAVFWSKSGARLLDTYEEYKA